MHLAQLQGFLIIEMTVDPSALSNEKVLFLLNKSTGMAPYSHEFVMGGIDTQVLSGFVSAMGNFMGEVTGDEFSRWKTHYGSDHVFIVEGGEWVVGVLAVSRETNEVRSKLRRVVNEFEEDFAFLRNADAIEGNMFDEFDHYVRRIFLGDRLSKRSIIMKRPDAEVDSEIYSLPSTAFRVAKMIHHIGDGITLGKLARQLELDLEETKDLVSRAFWRHAIYILYVPADDDILVMSERSSSILLSKENPLDISPRTIRIVASLDGRTPLSSFLSEVPLEYVDQVLSEIADFINMGYIQRISLERKLVLIEECVLREVLNVSADILGSEIVSEYLHKASKEGIELYPWIARIDVSSELEVESKFDVTMTPADFDEMDEAISFVIDRLTKQVGTLLEEGQADSIARFARKNCRKRWKKYFTDVTI